jgi:hypothetical protein
MVYKAALLLSFEVYFILLQLFRGLLKSGHEELARIHLYWCSIFNLENRRVNLTLFSAGTGFVMETPEERS